MKEWNKGILEYACLDCGKVVARKGAEIRQAEGMTIYIHCSDCAKKLSRKN